MTMNAAELQEAEKRWRGCRECKEGVTTLGECSKCGRYGHVYHAYPMRLMAMSLPTRELHVAAHETLIGKKLCADCSHEHHLAAIQTIWFDRQPQLQSEPTTK